ncbi:MAG: tRNA dimethylallyltransferase [Planctomycetota bacterium]|jgi:tRNA dimethylallyltransferase
MNQSLPLCSEICALVGPTAAGKSELAMAVAERAGAQIISLDSMLVYRGMDIGTAKPDRAMRERVPHHMIDLVETDLRYDVQRFLTDLKPVLESIEASGARALFVGGTAFYLKVLTHGIFEGPPADLELRERLEREALEIGLVEQHARLSTVDPESAGRLHPNDTRRVVRALEVYEQTGRTLSAWQSEWKDAAGAKSPGHSRRLVGVGHAVPDLDARILARTHRMLDAGWVEEATRIRAGIGFGPTAIQALGYAEILQLADSEIDREDCTTLIALRTRQFARKQRTWYRKFEEINWLDGEVEHDLDRLCATALEAFGW